MRSPDAHKSFMCVSIKKEKELILGKKAGVLIFDL